MIAPGPPALPSAGPTEDDFLQLDAPPPRDRGRRSAATLVTLLIPGAGHFTLGYWRRGLGWLLVFPVAVYSAFFVPYGTSTPFADIAFGWIVRLAAVVDLLVVSIDRRRCPSRAQLLGTALALTIVAFVWMGEYDRFWTYSQRTGTMMNTLQPGDFVLIDSYAFSKRALRPIDFLAVPYRNALDLVRGQGRPVRGDLVVALYPRDETKAWILRVLGIGGDTVQMRGARVLINGRLVEEPYLSPAGVVASAGECRHFYACEHLILPKDWYFVLADNRGTAQDSRYFGPLPLEKITGRPLLTNWAWDHNEGKIRWRRLGHILR